MLRGAVVVALSLAAALIAASAEVSYVDSDPHGTLLTAQAILEHGTLALDAYRDLPSDHRFMRIGAHTFYAYPPGTPIAMVPAVAVARLAGFDMARWQDDYALQRVLAAMSVGATALLMAILARRWVSWPLAVVLTAGFVFGTPVMSTMGTALWSTNLMVLITLGALLLMPCGGRWPQPLRAGAIGAMFGFAFWCRPPAFVIGGLAIVWMCGRALQVPRAERRPALVGAAALAGAVMASPMLLIAVSRLTYGSWLPDYYAGARAAASERFGTALVAHLVSPSRGLLIFAPIAALAIVVAALQPRRVLRAPLVPLAVAWLCLHLLIVSRFPYWWGGYSYGSRLLVDALPAVFVLTCAAAAVVRERSTRWRAPALAALVLAGAGGVWINSVQGLFNPATKAWNAWPNIDTFPGYALDWRAPQFLATDVQLHERMRRHEAWWRPPLDAQVEYTAASPRLDVRGWPSLEDLGQQHGGSAGAGPSIRFLVAETTVRASDRLMLTLSVGAEHPTTGEVWFNGRRVAQLDVRSREPQYHVIGIPRALVLTAEYDVLESNVLEWRTIQGRTPALFDRLRVHAGRRRH